eukprot:EG_transcript_52175
MPSLPSPGEDGEDRKSVRSGSSQASVTSLLSYGDVFKPEQQKKNYVTFVTSAADHVERALDLLSHDLPPGAAVMEIGTRNAATLRALHRLAGPGGSVVGIAMGQTERDTALQQL